MSIKLSKRHATPGNYNSFPKNINLAFTQIKTRFPKKMTFDDRCYLKDKPDDIFHIEDLCRNCEGYDRFCDRYAPNQVMDELKHRKGLNRGRPIKALDDYVNELVRINGR